MRTLRQINAVYEKILCSDMNERVKKKKFASLIREIKKDYHIPLIINKDWEQDHLEVMALYRKIEISRDS
ncbi:hypothetical protein EV146_11473 [Mesobacillus foraminis]|uniref:Uncharacterized protein n=1 Tax=Mesobacillus foraminis TaxID=279826 RepID=A0A4R2B519_9BACI|nr:hypothetical protein EV146_11473 [Mesobacillus foraminis]